MVKPLLRLVSQVDKAYRTPNENLKRNLNGALQQNSYIDGTTYLNPEKRNLSGP